MARIRYSLGVSGEIFSDNRHSITSPPLDLERSGEAYHTGPEDCNIPNFGILRIGHRVYLGW